MSFELHRRCSIHYSLDVVCRFLIIACLTATATSYDPGSRLDGSLAQLLRNPFQAYKNSGDEGVFDGDTTTRGSIDPNLEATFNYEVKSPSQLCPKRFAFLYLLSRDVKYLKDCGNFLGISNRNASSPITKNDPPAKPSYSGKLLKRILQNMDAGTIKTDFLRPPTSSATKRARLSVNSALSSLADMLRHESSGHREPVYAFHREMLKMG